MAEIERGIKTISATGVEETLGATVTEAGTVTLSVDISDLQRGDRVRILGKKKLEGASASQFTFKRQFSWINPEVNVELPSVTLGTTGLDLQCYVEQLSTGVGLRQFEFRIDNHST